MAAWWEDDSLFQQSNWWEDEAVFDENTLPKSPQDEVQRERFAKRFGADNPALSGPNRDYQTSRPFQGTVTQSPESWNRLESRRNELRGLVDEGKAPESVYAHPLLGHLDDDQFGTYKERVAQLNEVASVLPKGVVNNPILVGLDDEAWGEYLGKLKNRKKLIDDEAEFQESIREDFQNGRDWMFGRVQHFAGIGQEAAAGYAQMLADFTPDLPDPERARRAREWFDSPSPDAPDPPMRGLDRLARSWFEKSQANMRMAGFSRPEALLARMGTDAIDSMPYLASGVFASTIFNKTPYAGELAMASLVGPGEYARARLEKNMEPLDALKETSLRTLAEVVPERMTGIFQRAANGVRGLRGLATQTLGEAGSEMITELANIGIDIGQGLGAPELSEGAKRIGYAGGVGAMMGGPASLPALRRGEQRQKPVGSPVALLDDPSPSGGASEAFDAGFKAVDEALGESAEIGRLGADLDAAFEQPISLLSDIAPPAQVATPSLVGVGQPVEPPESGVQFQQQAVPELAAEAPEPIGREQLPKVKNEAGQWVDADPRLMRPEYRNGLLQLSNELIKGGNIGVVQQGGERRPDGSVKQSYEDTIRTPSENPAWFQSLSADTGMSTDRVKNAVQSALEGRNLGVRQAEVVNTMLGLVQDARTGVDPTYGPEFDSWRDMLSKFKEMRAEEQAAAAEAEFSGLDGWDPVMAGEATEVYAQAYEEYANEFTSEIGTADQGAGETGLQSGQVPGDETQGQAATEASQQVAPTEAFQESGQPSEAPAPNARFISKRDKTFDKSSTQVNLPEDVGGKVVEFGQSIPEEDVYQDEDGTKGREDEPHVTVLYGIDGDSHKPVAKALEGAGPIRGKLGKVSVFKNDEYDVLKVDVEGDSLRSANKALTDSVSFENDFPDYKPHVTIAYLKPGRGEKYAGSDAFEGTEFVADEVLFSSTKGEQYGVRLQEQAEPLAQPEAKGAVPDTARAEEPAPEPETQPEGMINEAKRLGEENPDGDVAELRSQALKKAKNYDSRDIDDVTEAVHEGQYAAIKKTGEAIPVPVRESDVNPKNAFDGTSHTPERREKSYRRDYVRSLVAAWQGIDGQITDENRDRVIEQFKTFKEGYASRMNAFFSAHGRVMSTNITGPANFPVRSNQKKSDTADKRMQEALDWYRKGKKRLARAIRGPIDKAPASELDVAKSKLADREALQQHMKDINKAHRAFLKNPESLEKSKLSDTDKAVVRNYKPPYDWEPHPFAPYQLSNNNSEISRLKKRVESLSKTVEEGEAAGGLKEFSFDGGTVELDYTDGYLRIRHDEKPSADVRTKLKSNGFRWSPKNTAWQRKLTDNAKVIAQRLTGAQVFEKTDQGVAPYNRSTESQSPTKPGQSGLSIERIEAIVGEHKAPRASKFKVVANQAEMPDVTGMEPLSTVFHGELEAYRKRREWMRQQQPESERKERQDDKGGEVITDVPFGKQRQSVAGGVEGMYDPNSDTIYLFADQFASEDRVRWVSWHELWHRGARVAFGDTLDRSLNDALTNPVVRRLANAVYADRDMAADVEAGKLSEDRARLIAAEEALAELDAARLTEDFDHIQERYKVRVPGSMKAGWRKTLADFFARIRELLGRVLKRDTSGMTDQEVREVIQEASEVSGEAMPEMQGEAMASEGQGGLLDEATDQERLKDRERQIDERLTGRDRELVDVDEGPGGLFGEDPTTKGQQPLFSKAPPTESKAFKEWFGDSKVVDGNGKPLVVYHTTLRDFEAFDKEMINSRYQYSIGFHFTDRPAEANTYTRGRDGPRPDDVFTYDGANIVPVYLKAENPLEIVTSHSAASMEADLNRREMIEKLVKAKRAGNPYDAVIIRRERGDEYDGINVIVFEPTQIKSATGNRGTFDPNDPNILQSRAPGLDFNPDFSAYSLPTMRLAEALKDDSLTLMDKALKGTENLRLNARQTAQDKMIPVKRIQEAIEKSGATVSEFADVYEKEQLLSGRVEDQFDQMHDQDLHPLAVLMNKHDVSREQLGEYLYARHAQARNERIASINENFPDGGSGMINAEAQKVLDKFEADGLSEPLQEMAAIVDRITSKTRENYRDYGLLDAQVLDSWEQETEFNNTYVPLRGFADALQEEFGRPGKGFDIRGDETKRALGRRSKAGDIIGHVLSAYKLSVIRGEKNRVGQSLLRLAVDNPNPNLWEINPVTMKTVLDPKTGMTTERVDLNLNDPNMFYTKVDGKAWRIELKDKRLARAMKNLGADNMNALVQGLSLTTRYLSLTRTMLSPEFVITNFMRDAQTAAVNLSGEQGRAIAKAAINRKAITHSMRAMFNEQRGGEKGDPEWRRYAREYTKDGGRVAFFRAESVEELARKVDRLQRMAGKDAGAVTLRALKAGYEFIEDMNLAVENAVRLAAYKAARENGVSRQKAAVLAKNLTVNFNRKGTAGPGLNAFYMFANASIQGAQRTLQAARNPRVQKVLLSSALFGTMMTILNELAGGDDDDGESFYSKIPDFEKGRKFIIMIPDPVNEYVRDLPGLSFVDSERKRGAYLTIHLPYGYSVPYVMGEVMGSTMFGVEPSEAATRMISAINNSFNPMGGSDLWSTVAPTLADPFLEVVRNKNFMGGPVHPQENPFDSTPAPKSGQGWSSTAGPYKWVAGKMNDWSGGTDVQPGWFDYHPETYRHFLEFSVGGTGSFFERVADNVHAAIEPEREVDVNRIPFMRQFFGTTRDYADRDRYYRNIQGLEYLAKEDEDRSNKVADGEMREDRYEEWVKDREEVFDSGLIGRAKGTEKTLRRLRKHLKDARQHSAPASEIKELEDEILKIQRDFNTDYNKVMLDRGWLRSVIEKRSKDKDQE